jgi:tRNA dimethylallyltransferase
MTTVPADAPAWNSTGYGAVRRGVLGECSRANAYEEILIATRQYAKRQRTWFRHQLPADAVMRLDPLAPAWRDAVAAWMEAGRAGEGII